MVIWLKTALTDINMEELKEIWKNSQICISFALHCLKSVWKNLLRSGRTHISDGVCRQDILPNCDEILKPSVPWECFGDPFFLIDELEVRRERIFFCNDNFTGEPYGVQRSSWSVSWSQRRRPPERPPQRRREERITSQGWLTTKSPHLQQISNIPIPSFG